MIRPPDVHDCGCGGGVHLACAESIGRYETEYQLALIEAEEATQTVDGFNERFDTNLTHRDFMTICTMLDERELIRCAMWRAGWH